MGSREALLRLQRFQVNENRRKIAQIEGMIAECERIATVLECEIKDEQSRAGIYDPSHIAYPTYAKAAMQRRANLMQSADDLRGRLGDAEAALTEAIEELTKGELRELAQQQGRTEPDAGTPDAFGAALSGAKVCWSSST
jgi:flagellar FliJ protein